MSANQPIMLLGDAPIGAIATAEEIEDLRTTAEYYEVTHRRAALELKAAIKAQRAAEAESDLRRAWLLELQTRRDHAAAALSWAMQRGTLGFEEK